MRSAGRRKIPKLKDIAARMQLVEGNSIDELKSRVDDIDLIYLDPMFPGRQKSGLINKKLQLIQKLEPPCSDEVELFEAAIQAKTFQDHCKTPAEKPISCWEKIQQPEFNGCSVADSVVLS